MKFAKAWKFEAEGGEKKCAILPSTIVTMAKSAYYP